MKNKFKSKHYREISGMALVPLLFCFLYAAPVSNYYKYNVAGNDTLLVKGRVKEEPYESKKGIIADRTEFYFYPDSAGRTRYKLMNVYFIKLGEGTLLSGEIKKYAGKNVRIKGLFKKGLWDATNEQHQSRYGEYVAVFKIMEA